MCINVNKRCSCAVSDSIHSGDVILVEYKSTNLDKLTHLNKNQIKDKKKLFMSKRKREEEEHDDIRARVNLHDMEMHGFVPRFACDFLRALRFDICGIWGQDYQQVMIPDPDTPGKTIYESTYKNLQVCEIELDLWTRGTANDTFPALLDTLKTQYPHAWKKHVCLCTNRSHFISPMLRAIEEEISVSVISKTNIIVASQLRTPLDSILSKIDVSWVQWNEIHSLLHPFYKALDLSRDLDGVLATRLFYDFGILPHYEIRENYWGTRKEKEIRDHWIERVTQNLVIHIPVVDLCREVIQFIISTAIPKDI